uniref:Uncharacterized protein n=1 Tax=Plectus sambesii TaxID=2011161 RepID=A0A914VP28_9BILA
MLEDVSVVAQAPGVVLLEQLDVVKQQAYLGALVNVAVAAAVADAAHILAVVLLEQHEVVKEQEFEEALVDAAHTPAAVLLEQHEIVEQQEYVEALVDVVVAAAVDAARILAVILPELLQVVGQ